MDPLVIQLLVGTTLGLLAQRFGVPVLTGFVLAGVALAEFGLTEGSYLTELSELGVLLLLFTVGLHIDLRDVLRREVLITGTVHWLVGGMMFIVLALGFSVPLIEAAVLAAILGFSSTVLAAQTLDRNHEVTAYHGRIAIGILILQDLAAVTILVLLNNSPSHHLEYEKLFFLLFACLLAGYVAFKARERVLQLVSFVLVAIVLAELFHLIGLGAELGALIAGVFVRRVPGHKEVAEALWGLKEYFLIGFFLQVGLQADPSWATFLLSIPLLFILPAKAIFFFTLLRLVGLRSRTAFLSGALLTSYSEFALIAVNVAGNSGYVSETWQGAVTLAVVFAFLLYMPITKLNHGIYSKLEPLLLRVPFPAMQTTFDSLPSDLGNASYLAVGLGRTGQAAMNFWDCQGMNAVGLDADAKEVAEQGRRGINAKLGDALDLHQWASFDLARLKGVVIALPGAEARLLVAKLVRQQGYEGNLTSFALDDIEAQQLREAGVDHVSTILTDAGERMAEQALPE